jgi:hypothetical protein
VDEERRIAVWSLKTNCLLVSIEIEGPGNMVLVDPTSNDEILIFYVLGSSGFF